ncbi:hypothetical protein PR202_ga03459 [Eleusine coracana subsp. coracana]|uniref:Uncharacterized protein n=1 Tax=Eleusine coracana subsp. coracana TaxID=191504 RepID=A0AAV5BP42_ELECO|nr:hypothetical protein PR202_ga03459 [Eleusine coracana subsp. coracana]
MSFAPAKTLFPSRFPPPPLLPASPRPSLQFRAAATAAVAGENAATASRTTARERRLVNVREERRRREYDREHTYPGWAKVLENACKDDEELRAILGDSIGNPDLMKQRVSAFLDLSLLANSMMEFDPSYDSEEASAVMPSSFHDIGDVEFQDNWARGGPWNLRLSWAGCSTELPNTAELRALGYQTSDFGGKKMGDWEEGMTSSDYGYKHFKI